MKNNKGFQVLANTVMLIETLLVILPFLLLFMSSITSESTLLTYGYSFFPKEFSLESFNYIFRSSNKIFTAYTMTILITAIGTVLNVALSTLMAYPLAQKRMPFRKAMTFFVFFTMLFSGGLVPSYILWTRYLVVKDTIWGMILPSYLVSGMNVLLIRTYFANSVPEALYEAAHIDGAGQFRTFLSIALPLGKPILVTMGTFSALTYWNDWTNGLYYITKRRDLYGIQNVLNQMVTDLQFLSSSSMSGRASEELARVPSTGVQMAIAFVAILPVLAIFPFLQKYYQKGISLGAVKG
ncbi:MAG: carbohydrate ABC transporter permease [Clostridiales bacterium]|nr:carbohydrate ABC transporter permease [Clostridiales bacterium]